MISINTVRGVFNESINIFRNVFNASIKNNITRTSFTISDLELGINKNYKKLPGGYYILNGIYYDKNHDVCHFTENAFDNV